MGAYLKGNTNRLIFSQIGLLNLRWSVFHIEGVRRARSGFRRCEQTVKVMANTAGNDGPEHVSSFGVDGNALISVARRFFDISADAHEGTLTYGHLLFTA